MIKFKASRDQLIEIALKAINASSPVGMGYLHYEPRNYTREDLVPDLLEQIDQRGVYIDYFAGRMVKLNIFKVRDEQDVYEARNILQSDYQSFVLKYKDMKALLDTVPGIEYLN